MNRNRVYVPGEQSQAGRRNSAVWSRVLVLAALGMPIVGRAAPSQDPPNTITFGNNSGENATVKLVGPTYGYVAVRDKTEKTVHVAAGRYHIVVRYCDSSNHCRYNKGDTFDVIQTQTEYSQITITLNVVPDGNYRTIPASVADFGG